MGGLKQKVPCVERKKVCVCTALKTVCIWKQQKVIGVCRVQMLRRILFTGDLFCHDSENLFSCYSHIVQLADNDLLKISNGTDTRFVFNLLKNLILLLLNILKSI